MAKAVRPTEKCAAALSCLGNAWGVCCCQILSLSVRHKKNKIINKITIIMIKTLLKIYDVLNKLITSPFESKSKEQKDIFDGLKKRINEEIWIVVAGKSGTGKTTLINYLFDPEKKLKEGVGDFGTSTPYTEYYDLGQGKGRIKFTDLPGIGESEESNNKNNSITFDYISECDLVIWLFKSDDNAKIAEQSFFRNLDDKIKRKFILGLSKVDQPVNRGFWDEGNNQPSDEIKTHIQKRIKSIQQKINIPEKKIIDFSVYKEYHIDILVGVMIMNIEGKGDVLQNDLAVSI